MSNRRSYKRQSGIAYWRATCGPVVAQPKPLPTLEEYRAALAEMEARRKAHAAEIDAKRAAKLAAQAE